MKTTGIIRRIDDLGRIVIPKEIRKNMRIDNGDSLEIFTEEDAIIFKKYSPIESLEDVASKYCEALYQTIRHNILVTDKDRVIACSGPLKNKYLNKKVSSFISRSIERRDNFIERQRKLIEIINDEEELCLLSFSSIINNGDVIGSVIILSTDRVLTDVEEKMATVFSNLLSKFFID